jgi:hypothetical protein
MLQCSMREELKDLLNKLNENRRRRRTTYEFSLELAEETPLDAEGTSLDIAETVYASIDDVLVSYFSGRVFVGFGREAESLLSAIKSALKEIEHLGFKVERVTIDRDSIE